MPKYCPTLKIVEGPDSIEIFNNTNNIPIDLQELKITCDKFPDTIINRTGLTPNFSIYKKEGLVPDLYKITITGIYSGSPNIPCGIFEKRVIPPPLPPVENQCPVFTVTEEPNSITITKNGGTTNNIQIRSEPNNRLGLEFVEQTFRSGILPPGSTTTFILTAIFPNGPPKECYRIIKNVAELPPPPPPIINQCPVFTITETSNSIIIDKTGDINVEISRNPDFNPPRNIRSNNLFIDNDLTPGTYTYSLFAIYLNERKSCGTITKTVSDTKPPVQLKPKKCPNFIVLGNRTKINIKLDTNNSGDPISTFIIKCDKVVDNIAPDTTLYEGLDEYQSGKLHSDEIYTFSIYVKYSNNPDNPEEEYLCTRIIKNVPPKTKVLKEYQCPLFNISEKKKKVKITHRHNTGKNIERILL